jgi:hypothetical protein
MSRQNVAVRSTSFSQIDDLTREISELAGFLNAKFIVDDGKVQALKSSVPSGGKEKPTSVSHR